MSTMSTMGSKDWVCLVRTEEKVSLAVFNPDDNCWYRYSDGRHVQGQVTEYISLADVYWTVTNTSLSDRHTITDCNTLPVNCYALCIVQLSDGRLALAYSTLEGWRREDGWREVRGEVVKFIVVSDINAKVHSV